MPPPLETWGGIVGAAGVKEKTKVGFLSQNGDLNPKKTHSCFSLKIWPSQPQECVCPPRLGDVAVGWGEEDMAGGPVVVGGFL